MFDIRGAPSDVQVDEPKAGVQNGPKIFAAAFFLEVFLHKVFDIHAYDMN